MNIQAYKIKYNISYTEIHANTDYLKRQAFICSNINVVDFHGIKRRPSQMHTYVNANIYTHTHIYTIFYCYNLYFLWARMYHLIPLSYGNIEINVK